MAGLELRLYTDGGSFTSYFSVVRAMARHLWREQHQRNAINLTTVHWATAAAAAAAVGASRWTQAVSLGVISCIIT